MKIQHLKLVNFRNYEKVELDFSDKFNIFYGLNGVGKTNLIESIYVLALTKSFRGSVDKVLLMNNKDVCKVEGKVQNKYVDNYKIILKSDGKKVKINNTQIPKLSDYISNITVVLFNPDDLRFIKDSPSIRRKIVNLEISQLNNVYLKKLNEYEKLLKQRNMYLKGVNLNGNKSLDYLDILTNKLIEVGLYIYKERLKYINLLNDKLGDYYEKICGISNLSLKYSSDFDDDIENIVNKYKKCLNKDIILGKTTVGIHHDDFIFYMNDMPIKDYGSEGQQKNAIIAYKLRELDIFKEIKGNYPILILDDLFSELDGEKINNIMMLINSSIQTFITTTDINKIDDKLLKQGKLFHVLEGEIKEG